MEPIERLYEQYFRDVLRYCRALTRDPSLAEDVAQETFVKAMKGLRAFRGDCDVRSWLCQIAKHTYLSHCRKAGREAADTLLERADPSPSVEQRLSDQETALEVHRALHELPEPYREVFYLRVFGELPFAQIGQVFGQSANWACVTFHRAKQRIQKKLEGSDI